ncbi:collagen alpha-1(I) chain-like [Cricetulus griseus]|uniref:Collagen alpha-1(I) chain-like n=1 Tax=Cricetulus griseus TaxID=10029 RepID=A0A9J7K6L0_CRIGR|nr:collagen alpha-1(I) chain-like [Cricetulus griseus]
MPSNSYQRGGLQLPAAGSRGPQRPGLPPRLHGSSSRVLTATPKPAGSPEGARGAEPPTAAHTPAGSRRRLCPGDRGRALPPGPSSNMSPNLPPRVRAARQCLMDSSRRRRRRGRPPAARQPPVRAALLELGCPRHRLGQWVPPSRDPELPKNSGSAL